MGTELDYWTPAGTNADTTVSAEVLELIAESVPDNTRRAYAGDWARFTQWCEGAGRTAAPCTPETLVQYSYFLMTQKRAPSTIMRAVATVRVVHKLSGHVPPDTLPTQRAVQGYKKRRAAAGVPNEKQAEALSLQQLRRIAHTLGTGRELDVRDRAIVVLGWAMMARRGELAALNIDDARMVDNGLQVVVRQSKADQDANGRKVALKPGSDSLTCPVRTVRAWLQLMASRGITEGPLFRRVDAHGRIFGQAGPARLLGRKGSPDGRLTGPGVWHIIKHAAERAGLDASCVQAHSLRAGGATGAYLGGADLLTISRHGGWKDGSQVVMRYIRDVDAWEKNAMDGAGL